MRNGVLIPALSLALSLLVSASAMADCITRADGIAPKGTRILAKDTKGEWVYQTTLTLSNFEFEKRTEFLLPNGAKAVVLVLYAPGYDPECSLQVFAVRDLIFY